MSGSADELFAGPGETRAALRAVDWAATPLGPAEEWPVELRAAVRTVLPSRIPMLLWWGPRLVQIFNDAYTPVLGDKYPAALGQPAEVCWAEVWDELGPLAEQVLAGQGATYAENQLLFLERHGYLEETYWTFSYSPVYDENKAVVGIFVATTDVTPRVLGERRLETLRQLGMLSITGDDPAADACRAAVEVLAGSRVDLPLAMAYLTTGGDELDLVASFGVKVGSTLAPKRRRVDEAAAVVTEAMRHGRSGWLIDMAERHLHAYDLEDTRGDLQVDKALVLPLTVPGRAEPFGVLILGVSPHRAFDDAYRTFLELVGARVSAVLADALAYDAERRRSAALAELDAAKTRFLQNISHEFRTPLTLLVGPLRTLLDEHAHLLPPDQHQAMAAAHRSAQRLRRLVDTLLDVARAEADELHARPVPTDAAALTAECAAMFQSAAEHAGLELVVDVGPAAGTVVALDREMWARIVLNLVGNAIKYTPAGSVTVSLRIDEDGVRLAVADTGVGIPDGEQTRIFDRFHKVATTSGRGQGVGIGLALVADLAAALSGRVEVRSAPGVGSTFTVTVPRAGTDEPPYPTPASVYDLGATFLVETREWEPGAHAEPAVGSESRRRVLLVEDNVDLREYLTRLLCEQHWAVDAVGDTETALELVGTRRPDLVLSDVMLPGRDGLELLRELRAHPLLVRIPVILLTARAGPESAVEGLRLGADDYVIKPFHPVELVARVRVHLELSALREELIAASERETQDMRAALRTRGTISQAVGLIMAASRCDSDAAFDALTRMSQHRNVKVREVAAEMVANFTASLQPAPVRSGQGRGERNGEADD